VARFDGQEQGPASPVAHCCSTTWVRFYSSLVAKTRPFSVSDRRRLKRHQYTKDSESKGPVGLNVRIGIGRVYHSCKVPLI
jgi:hypothetical protein